MLEIMRFRCPSDDARSGVLLGISREGRADETGGPSLKYDSGVLEGRVVQGPGHDGFGSQRFDRVG